MTDHINPALAETARPYSTGLGEPPRPLSVCQVCDITFRRPEGTGIPDELCQRCHEGLEALKGQEHQEGPVMAIDPQKLLELARERQGPGGVTLGWPTVIQIIEELHRLQHRVRYFEKLESNVPACRFHDRDFEACIGYCSTVPCEPRPEEQKEPTP